MRWVCPGCGSQVSIALNVCPNCGSTPEKASASSAAATPAAQHEAKPAQSSATPAHAPTPAAAPPPAPEPSGPPRQPRQRRGQRLLPVPRRVAREEEERESPFWRGVKFGIGFMLAVAMILLLLALLLVWLRQQGWQPWLVPASP